MAHFIFVDKSFLKGFLNVLQTKQNYVYFISFLKCSNFDTNKNISIHYRYSLGFHQTLVIRHPVMTQTLKPQHGALIDMKVAHIAL